MFNKLYDFLFNPKVRKIVLAIMEVLGQWLRDEISPEVALKKIVDILWNDLVGEGNPPTLAF